MYTSVATKDSILTSLILQEQFILSYGGLRGAVGFSLVTILDQDHQFKNIFLTTTLFIIFFTVFVQGIDIILMNQEYK